MTFWGGSELSKKSRDRPSIFYIKSAEMVCQPKADSADWHRLVFSTPVFLENTHEFHVIYTAQVFRKGHSRVSD